MPSLRPSSPQNLGSRAFSVPWFGGLAMRQSHNWSAQGSAIHVSIVRGGICVRADLLALLRCLDLCELGWAPVCLQNERPQSSRVIGHSVFCGEMWSLSTWLVDPHELLVRVLCLGWQCRRLPST